MLSSLKEISIKTAFAIPFLFWIYLLFFSRMDIHFDAANYESLAVLLRSEGFVAFLKQGPFREPLYPFVIFTSMKLASFLGISYYKIQTCLQIVLLFSTQYLLYRTLMLLKIEEGLISILILYFGLSPAIINATFSLFSEIVALPLIISALLSAISLWQSILEENFARVFRWGFLFALTATAVTFSKAILEYTFLLFLLPFAGLAIQSLLKKKFKRCACAIAFFSIFIVLFEGTITGYKSLNQRYNGHFALTDSRGQTMLYHYTMRRTPPLSKNLLPIAFFSIPGENVCKSVYGEACKEWWYDNYSLAEKMTKQIRKWGVVPEGSIPRVLFDLALEQILRHPLQYGLFASFEALKLLFWESTNIGYVFYPRPVRLLYDLTLVGKGLRLLMFLITFFSLTHVSFYLFRQRSLLCRRSSNESERVQRLFFLWYFAVLFVGLYTSILTIARYALPIVPLYIAIIAFSLNQLFFPLRRSGQ